MNEKIYYCIQHTDGIREFGFADSVSNSLTESVRYNLQIQNPSARNIIFYPSHDEWLRAKNNSF
jgi:hypothetical protein